MIHQNHRIQLLAKVFLVLFSSAFFNLGCKNNRSASLAEAVEEINSSTSGFVQVVEHSGKRFVAKYLTPEYLAWTEIHDKNDNRSIDSLANLYRNGLRFHVSIPSSGKSIRETPIQGDGLVQGEGGILDVDSLNGLFHLEAEGRRWEPVSVLPEVRAGVSGESWLVVFAINPDQEFNRMKTVSLVYSNSSQNALLQFTYKVADLLRPTIIASNE